MDILSSMDFRQEGRADEYGLLVCRHPVSAMGAFHLVANANIPQKALNLLVLCTVFFICNSFCILTCLTLHRLPCQCHDACICSRR